MWFGSKNERWESYQPHPSSTKGNKNDSCHSHSHSHSYTVEQVIHLTTSRGQIPLHGDSKQLSNQCLSPKRAAVPESQPTVWLAGPEVTKKKRQDSHRRQMGQQLRRDRERLAFIVSFGPLWPEGFTTQAVQRNDLNAPILCCRQRTAFTLHQKQMQQQVSQMPYNMQ